MSSLSLTLPLVDWWHLLSEGARDGVIAGAVLAVAGVAIAIFRKALVAGLGRVLKRNPSSSLAAPPQEFTFKFDGLQPVSPPVPQSSGAARLTPPSNIPRPPLAGFVARRDTDGRDIVERLKEELAPEKNQLIVLWGAGGVGKTTLAAETARLLRDVFSDGIIWLSAEGRPDFSLSALLDEIAIHLSREDIRQLAPGPKDEQLHNALANAPNTLIVLDNFETVALLEQDKCAEWLAKRANCPTLITTRDEVVHARPVHVLAMSLPEAHEFLQKLLAQVQNPRAFEGLDRERIILAADRIPLVLQWVVKRIDSAKQPQTVLDDLAHGEGDAAKRVFDRSFDLPQMGNDGRAGLLALSLFVPSASRTALAEVAGFSNNTERLDATAQQLTELWLIETSEGNERLSVEGLTRELALARLSRDDHSEEYRQRFVTYFSSYTLAHEQPTSECYEALEFEKDNIISAVDLAIDLKDWHSVKAIADVLALPVTGMLSVHGYWDQAIRMIEQGCNAAAQTKSDSDIAVFKHNLAVMHGRRGESAKARELCHESVEISKKLGNKRGIAISLHQLARLAQAQGEFEEAQQLYNETLEISKELGNQQDIASTLHNLAVIAQDQGNLDEAKQLYNESLEIKKRFGNQNSIAASLHQLALFAQGQGQPDEARRLYYESLAITRSLGHQSGIAATLHQLGILAQNQKEIDNARLLYQESLEIAKKIGVPSGIACTLHQLAQLAQQQGDVNEARQLNKESLEIEQELGNLSGVAFSLAQSGRLAEEEGDNVEAARLFSEALGIFERLKSPTADGVRRDLERVTSKSS